MDTNKMRDISREQFEEVFQAKFPCIYAAAKAGESKAHGDMSVAWWGWQASREAVVIELPCDRSFSASDDPWFVREQCKGAIEDQGLKVAS